MTQLAHFVKTQCTQLAFLQVLGAQRVTSGRQSWCPSLKSPHVSLMPTTHTNATTTANCYLSTFNRNTLWIKMKVEDISQDPGTIPDVDLSSHRIRLLVLTT